MRRSWAGTSGSRAHDGGRSDHAQPGKGAGTPQVLSYYHTPLGPCDVTLEKNAGQGLVEDIDGVLSRGGGARRRLRGKLPVPGMG